MPALDLDNIFTYHAPTPEQAAKYEGLRAGARMFAQIVLTHTPECADQSAAIRHIREALMTANAAVATGGRLHLEPKKP